MSAPDSSSGITADTLREDAERGEERGSPCEDLPAGEARSAESHIAGVPDASTVTPAPSTADTTPLGPDCSRRPDTAVGNRTAASAGFAAAAASFTTRTSENPSTCAVTVRSTPGSTSG
jgi:hypothetical protein